jgi:hypothetical protein
MTSKSTFLVAAICAAPLSIAACGGGSDGPITPEGPHHGYVVSSVSVPASDSQAREFGFDLSSKTSSKPDGMKDIALSEALASLSSLGFKIQPTVDTAIDQGTIILLIDVQTKDFTNSNAAGFSVKLGATPMPAPCNGSGDAVCRHHLDGTGTFTIDPKSPTDAAVAGKVASGTFNGGPGDIVLQLAIGSTTPIQLTLLRASVKASSISDTGIMTAYIGGIVTEDELMNQIGPVLQAQIETILAANCTARTQPNACGCTGTAATLITFDTNHDCMLSSTEILTTQVVKGFLMPDSCSTDSCKTPDSYGIGIKVQAVKATFPM